MGLQALFFYLFSAIAVASALMVISSRNPVHSVLFLILTFFNAAALFLMTGAEFLAMILIVVYVGAVAVLFLFVVIDARHRLHRTAFWHSGIRAGRSVGRYRSRRRADHRAGRKRLPG